MGTTGQAGTDYTFESFDAGNYVSDDGDAGTGTGRTDNATDTGTDSGIGSGDTGRTRRRRRTKKQLAEEETLVLLSGDQKRTRRKKTTVDSGAISVMLSGAFTLIASTGRPHFEKTVDECTPFAEQFAECLETWQPTKALELMKYMQPLMMLSSLALLVGPSIAVELENAKSKHRLNQIQNQNGPGINTGTTGVSANIRVSDLTGQQPAPDNTVDRPNFTLPSDD